MRTSLLPLPRLTQIRNSSLWQLKKEFLPHLKSARSPKPAPLWSNFPPPRASCRLNLPVAVLKFYVKTWTQKYSICSSMKISVCKLFIASVKFLNRNKWRRSNMRSRRCSIFRKYWAVPKTSNRSASNLTTMCNSCSSRPTINKKKIKNNRITVQNSNN